MSDIVQIGEDTFKNYISILSIDKVKLAQTVGAKIPENISLFDLLYNEEYLCKSLIQAIDFFTLGTVRRSLTKNSLIIDRVNDSGEVNARNYDNVRWSILELCHMDISEERATPKNKKAAEILEKIQSYKDKKNSSTSKNLGLANIISALCVQHKSLNITNIWGLTIYQIYDQFMRQNYLNGVDIHAMNYAGCGGEFDPNDWYKNIIENNGGR